MLFCKHSCKPKKENIEKPQDKKEVKSDAPAPTKEVKEKPVKLTYKLEHELKKLPEKIQTVELSIKEYNTLLNYADYYARDPDGFHETIKALGEAQGKLERYENRWLELE